MKIYAILPVLPKKSGTLNNIKVNTTRIGAVQKTQGFALPILVFLLSIMLRINKSEIPPAKRQQSIIVPLAEPVMPTTSVMYIEINDAMKLQLQLAPKSPIPKTI